MGLGKTFTGAEKMRQLGGRVNLVVCQKSKIDDWIEHFRTHYQSKAELFTMDVWNLTTKCGLKAFLSNIGMIENGQFSVIGVINYELLFRRPELKSMKFDTLM